MSTMSLTPGELMVIHESPPITTGGDHR